jgi:hypothetical protein
MTDEGLLSKIRQLKAERQRLRAALRGVEDSLTDAQAEWISQLAQDDTRSPSGKVRTRDQKLAQMTEANGCTPAEAAVAASLRSRG